VIDGALLVDKPVGRSSNAVLQQVKKLLGARKAGHAGTLDPLASGLLVILFGEATKFAGLLLESDKEYRATLKLGETTSTGDAEGEILQRKNSDVSKTQILAALAQFRGAIGQLPPMYSALKRHGVPLYKLARRGETVERRRRQVEIFELEIMGLRSPLLELRIRCSKGTYIRTLAEDIGLALGTGAHLAALRRTASGRFVIGDAVSLDDIARLNDRQRQERLLPLGKLLVDLPRVELDAPLELRLRSGQALKISGLREGLSALYRVDGALIGLGRTQEGVLRSLRLTQAAEKHR
jgi:tRNA pseudouridine55 synthase